MQENKVTKHDGLQEAQKVVISLAIGSSYPKNEKEAKMLHEIREAEKNGLMLDMPLDG